MNDSLIEIPSMINMGNYEPSEFGSVNVIYEEDKNLVDYNFIYFIQSASIYTHIYHFMKKTNIVDKYKADVVERVINKIKEWNSNNN